MARVAQLRGQGGCVRPIDVGQGGAAEEVGPVLRQGKGGDATQHLGLLLDVQALRRDLCDRPIPGTDEEVAVRQQGGARDALRQQLLWEGGAEEPVLKVHLDHVARRGAAVAVLVVAVQEDVGRDALDLPAVHVRRPELLVLQIEVPDDDVVVPTRDELVLVVVEEADAVGGVRRSRCAANRGAALHLPNNEAVVVLAAQRREVGLVHGERQGGHGDLVEAQPMHLSPLGEVPNDDVGGEPHECLLPRREHLATRRHGYAVHLVVVALQEGLSLSEQVAHHDGAS
mmetsp:Transcript_98822/g.276755  ORF Transcript_98822/g.276755 Transcript_98822/m.276755 type:complete len:285 (+) Transcript_98822:796-1650(+)